MKKYFAKYMALLLTAVFAFSAVGCGKDKAEQQENAVIEEETQLDFGLVRASSGSQAMSG